MFKNNIRAQRRLKNLTQSQLAEFCGVTKNTISLYEIQKMQPRLEVAVKIAVVLGVDLDDLIDWRSIERRSYKAAK